MNIALKLIEKVSLLFLMLLPGIVLKKCKLSTDGLGKGLANLVLYIAQPALIIAAYIREYNSDIIWNLACVFVFSVLAHLLFALVAFLCYRKAEDGIRRMLRFATVFSNAAYMGIPLIIAVLGTEAAIYASVYAITFNLFVWSLGVYLCTEDKKQASPIKVLLHPVTISSLIGLLLFFLNISDYIPALATDALGMLEGLVAPLSMIIIGLRLADIQFKGMFRDKYLYEFLFLRLLFLPALVYAFIRVLILIGLPVSETVLTVVLLSAATPAATATSMFAEKYDCDATYAGKLVALSTLLSVITMPLVSLLLNI